MTVRWIAGAAISAAALGLMLVSGGTAFADAGTPPPPPTAAPVAGKDTCTVRIPKLLARIDRITTRIEGDAATKGSTAWLEARSAAARVNGNTALADLIDLRVAARPARADRLAQARTAIAAIQSKDCTG